MHISGTARGRSLVGALGASLLALCLGLPATGSAATVRRSTSGFTGERDGIGPMIGYVDPAHASAAAARAAAYAAHHPKTMRARSSVPGTATAAPTLAAAALDPAVYGQWSTLSYQLPLRAIHVTVLHTGKLLLIAGSGNVASDNLIGDFKAYLWDPTTDELTSVPVPYDAFCSAHLVDPDGDVLVFGGTSAYKTSTTPYKGSDQVYKFHVDTSTWEQLAPMKQARWYPTSVMDAHGMVYEYTGYDRTGKDPNTPELYDPTTGTSQWLAPRVLPLYPSLHLLKDGRLAYTGAYYGWSHNTVRPKVFDPRTGAYTLVSDPKAVVNITHRNAAMSAFVGSADQQLAWVAGGLTAVRSTYFVDFNAPKPTAVAGPALGAAKGYVSVADLPDLSVFETGGGAGYNSPVYEASILDPVTRTLTAVAPPTIGRTYHSSALTLPDGRVVTFGGDPSGDAAFELRVEVYSPPYLFHGDRPTIGAHPVEVGYGSSVHLDATAAEGVTLGGAVILRPGSATHSMDANQRLLSLTTTTQDGGVGVTMPTSANLAPPGWYLVFVNDSRGRPSAGEWIHLT